MEGGKKKISINDLRVDRGGDPEIYRRALLVHDASSDGVCSTTSPASASIDEACRSTHNVDQL